MIRLVVLVLGQESICFPSGPSNRILVGESCATANDPIANELCRKLAELRLRPTTIDTISQDGCNVMVILADMPSDNGNILQLREQLDRIGRDMKLTLRVQREDVFLAMHRI